MQLNAAFDFDDILIMPENVTTIRSRFEDINIDYIPLMTAPMDTVVNAENAHCFEELGITIVLPRGGEDRNTPNSDFISMSIDKFSSIYCNYNAPHEAVHPRVCIDVANGHMSTILEKVKDAKDKWGDSIEIMVGNIANPLTILEYDAAGADYVRCGIGFGGGCLTTQQTGIGLPMGSLIHECYEHKRKGDLKIKIVADGGFKKYSDIIKALALGADYVMLGSMFNKALESCADTFAQNTKHSTWKEMGERVDQYSDEVRTKFENGIKYFKGFRGMSTKEVQRDWGVDEEKIRTSEGISRINEVEYTLKGWMENFDSYLRSAMSYTNSRNLEEFKDNQGRIITPAAFKRFTK